MDIISLIRHKITKIQNILKENWDLDVFIASLAKLRRRRYFLICIIIYIFGSMPLQSLVWKYNFIIMMIKIVKIVSKILSNRNGF